MKQLFFGLPIFFLLLPSSQLNAGILIVPQDYSTIQEAIDSSSHGDTVMVQPGTYYEILYLTKGIHLLGSGMDATYIDGEEKGDSLLGSVVHVRSNGCVIEGFISVGKWFAKSKHSLIL